MLEIKLNRGMGNVKEGWVVKWLTLMSSFNVRQGGASTPDLVVAELRSWCGQIDRASAYVLHPLNHLVLDFVVWDRGWVNKRRSRGIPDQKCWGGLESEERSQGCEINRG